jgi:Ni/Fe-hydrogenase subunit HybB-like protein
MDRPPVEEPQPTADRSPQSVAAHQELREAAVRPMLQKRGPGYWLLLLGLGAVVALGLAAFGVQVADGLKVTTYSNEAFWDVNISNFITIIGMSYGGAVISAALRLTHQRWRAPLTRIAEACAVVAVCVGAACIVPSLGKPGRMWEFVTRPNLSSPLFWDALAIATYAFASIVFFYLFLIPDFVEARNTMARFAGRIRGALWRVLSFGWEGRPAQHRLRNRMILTLSVVIIPLAVCVHSVLGWAFANSSFRPWWHEELWAPLFVVAALYSGIALVIVALAALRHAYHLQEYITDRHFRLLGLILIPFGAGYFYMSIADFLTGSYHGTPGDAAVFRALFVGPYAPWFWLVMVGGMVVPVFLIALPKTGHRVGWIVTAAFIVLPAFWLNRVLQVIVPATLTMMTGVVSGRYHWTWVNASITAGAMAAIPFLLILLFRVVPILSVTDMEEAGLEAVAPARVLEPERVPAAQPSPTPTLAMSTAEGQVSPGPLDVQIPKRRRRRTASRNVPISPAPLPEVPR